MSAIRLGQFELVEPIASGGMGEVWRATHLLQDTPVAIKLLHAELGSDRDRRAFWSEVRAMARLDHPGVAWILDYGTVDADSAGPSTKLHAGTPWFAMEYASGGTLSALIGELPWTSVRTVLLCLLDALAHAHSRQLLHLDIKPSNVLISGPGDFRPGLKLTDFGIAHAVGEDARGRAIVGTPLYMAPELLFPDTGPLGPWTDLYGLGCLAWQLVTGQVPFRSTGQRLFWAHATQPVPRLEPTIAIPDGLEDWLRTLLFKRPTDRFRCAADASRSLRDLPSFDERPASRLGGLFVSPEMTPDEVTDPVPAPRVPQLVGAGLALAPVRSVRFVGRESERELAWGALRRVRELGSARLLVLRGPAGCGKSRLARWLIETAEERGLAQTFRGDFGPEAQHIGELIAMLRRHLAVTRLPPQKRVDALRGLLGGAQGRDLAEDLNALLDNQLNQDSPGRRHAVIREALAAMAFERPVIVWLDDAHWSVEALGWIRSLLSIQGAAPRPILVVVTIQEETLAERPAETLALDGLTTSGAADEIRLEVLNDVDQRRLLDGLLGLEPALAQAVLARTGGNPLFAVHLVRDWAARGLLTSTNAGFALDADTQDTIPATLAEIWQARVERTLSTLDAKARSLLETAAVLGHSVDQDEWERLGAVLAVPDDLRDSLTLSLLAARLWTEASPGYRFVHPMLAEALVAGASERAAACHAAAAEVIEVDHPVDRVRLGRHLYEAGQYLEAADHLFEGVLAVHVHVGDAATLQWAPITRRALSASGADPSDDRYARLMGIELTGLADMRQLEAALAVGDELERCAVAHGWKRERLIDSWLQRAKVLNMCLRNEESFETVARVLAEPGLKGHALAGAHWQLFQVHETDGNLDEAIRHGRAAVAAMNGDPSPNAPFNAALFAGYVCITEGDFEGARRHGQQMLRLAKARDRIQGQAKALNLLSEVAFRLGELDHAVEMCLEAEALFLRINHQSAAQARQRLARIDLHRGQYLDALRSIRQLFGGAIQPMDEPSFRLAEVLALAGIGDWEAAALAFEPAVEGITHRGRQEPDDVWLFDEIATRADGVGRAEMARICRQLAPTQLRVIKAA